jgi:alcohol dehydrogenase
MARAAGLVEKGESPAEALVGRLQALLTAAGLPTSLADCGVAADDVPELAAEAAAQWTASFNPRPVSAVEFEQLYHAALGG